MATLLDDVRHRGFFLLVGLELSLHLVLHTLDLSVVLLSEVLDLSRRSLDIREFFHDSSGIDDTDLLLSLSREGEREHEQEGNQKLLHCWSSITFY